MRRLVHLAERAAPSGDLGAVEDAREIAEIIKNLGGRLQNLGRELETVIGHPQWAGDAPNLFQNARVLVGKLAARQRDLDRLAAGETGK